MNQAITAHQKHPSTLTEAEVVDQLRQLGHAQAKPGDPHQLTGLLHPIVDKKRQLTGAAIGIDVEQARVAAVDETVKPFVRRVASAQGSVQAFFVVVVIGFGACEQCRERLVFLAQGFEILNELRRLGTVFTCGQPIA
ncbi:hypothetical protein D3C77_655710 [compost metagenome]